MSDMTPGRAAYEAYWTALGREPFRFDHAAVRPVAWEAAAQAAIKASDAADDFLFERKQVIELRAVLVEVFTCMETGDPGLVFDEDQIALWREQSGVTE